MSAGKGVTHSEANHFKDRSTEFLQIWITPDVTGIDPSYQQVAIDVSKIERNRILPVLASPNGSLGGVSINQDAIIYGGEVDAKTKIQHVLEKSRVGYFHLPKGGAIVGEMILEEGDGVYLFGPENLNITFTTDSYALVFDLTEKTV